MMRQFPRLLFYFVTALTLLVAVSDASAHRPASVEADGLTIIPDASTSYAYYQEIDDSAQVDIYEFAAEAGRVFHAGINIPQIEGLETYGVNLALLGPGLPRLNPDDLPSPEGGAHSYSDLPDAVLRSRAAFLGDEFVAGLQLATLSGLVVPNETGESFFEPFTQTNYWGRQAVDLELPATGTYYLLVWQPEGQPGKYVLDTGRDEVFGPRDLVRFPGWWINTHIYFEHTPYLAAGGLVLTLIAAAMGFGLFRSLRRVFAGKPADLVAAS